MTSQHGLRKACAMRSMAGSSHGLNRTAGRSTIMECLVSNTRLLSPIPRTWMRFEGWSRELGFSSLGVLSLSQEWSASEAVSRMRDWLAQGLHGEMSYLARHMPLRPA